MPGTADAEFGTWLTAERARLRVSLGAIARHAGISDETVRAAENGQRVRPATRDSIEDAIATIDALTRVGGDQLTRRVADLESEVAGLRTDLAGLRDDVAELIRGRSAPSPSPATRKRTVSPR